jgi:electron transfer flavoprotein beta subunit
MSAAGKVKATMVINPWDEYAAEEAILLGDRFDAESVAISMGSPDRWMRSSTPWRWA